MARANWDWCVYVLECNDGSWYCGVTNDLPMRMLRHEAGRASKCTRSKRPLKLIAVSQLMPKKAAMSMEASFKKLTKAQKTELLDNQHSALRRRVELRILKVAE